MRASSETNQAATGLRWTPGWVLLVSLLAPASAWSLHTVQPELVPWYVGGLFWLTLTPERRPRWMTIRAAVVPATAQTVAQAAPVLPPASALLAVSSVNTEAGSSTEKENTKAKKPRSKARKPKAVTLAEMKSLTGGADRAVVWSQVGPGKFVRQPGEENGESDGDDYSDHGDMPTPGNMVIEAVATNRPAMDEAVDSDE